MIVTSRAYRAVAHPWHSRVPTWGPIDLAAVTTDQIRQVVARLIPADHRHRGDPAILIVLDAGYDAPHIAHLLAGLPVQLVGLCARTGPCAVRRPPARSSCRPTRTAGARPGTWRVSPAAVDVGGRGAGARPNPPG
ncbi:transposase [Spirillospora sp. CA-255316]